ncbi:hypothetical protein MKZ08_13455 [Viridibacillus sp. FSL R5-0477]|uniref:Uncharacterized protein n=1 Tax=Viridibacillus arenosi FSL R5-213 TaxID=1227360 RepID=W4EUX1_9BACL|nr:MULTISPECIES: hypothetical protein [Viridibacillus]ETT84328.1 hypothetical protein C176_12003 [Viridibacillus arenosi FSL R5-213]OMC77691.1 hypothetical protein BK130_21460 [Viridibacillus sp. FSL H8-0123]OMC89626.1 hypothetical protein BK137_16220 [Viridibacillus arenosi]
MEKKIGISLSVLLLGFVVSYILTSAFAHYGINTSSLITGLLIVCVTVSLISLFEKIFPGRPEEAN